MRRWAWLAVLVAAVAGGGTYLWQQRDAAKAPAWRLAAVERGPLLTVVSSTGKVNPVVAVQVGSQVSGQISRLETDFNGSVTQGQVIARIDPAPFEARVRAAAADLASARANVAVQQASSAELAAGIAGAQAALKDTAQTLERSRALLERRVASESAVDKAVATRDQARAHLDGLRAQLDRQRALIEAAKAQVLAQEAVLHDRELDLAHTVIRSPVDGVVIDRSVDLGQTVAASLQAPVLFTIAQDLRQMQVEVSVDEADIGRVRDGQAVRFTVDAYQERRFDGRVTQVRKQPTEVSNVVTYTVIVSADNPDLALLPGMTANVEIVVGERRQALKVPEAALRFSPEGAAAATAAPAEDPATAARQRAQARLDRLTEQLRLSETQRSAVAAIFRETSQAIRALRQAEDGGGEDDAQVRQLRAQANRRIAALLDDGQRATYERLQAELGSGERRRGRVWRLDAEGMPVPVDVVVGLSDGSVAELLRGEIEQGERVIVGVAAPAAR